jgi:hypothetical protein
MVSQSTEVTDYPLSKNVKFFKAVEIYPSPQKALWARLNLTQVNAIGLNDDDIIYTQEQESH